MNRMQAITYLLFSSLMYSLLSLAMGVAIDLSMDSDSPGFVLVLPVAACGLWLILLGILEKDLGIESCLIGKE